VKSLAFGDYKVEFEQVRKLAADAKTAAEDAKTAAVGEGKLGSAPHPRLVTAVEAAASTDDPHKHQFTGKSFDANRYRVLQAEVSPINDTPGLFRVHLEVLSTRPKTHPLTGAVQFFLHPTFTNPRPMVRPGPNGVAELNLTAWGAFTVGVQADGGLTKLELDLAELETAAPAFRNR
jgi:hypothetical protein